MKKIALTFVTTIFILNSFLFAQETNRIGIGFNINQFQNDFGIGMHAVSPYFANKSVAIKFGGNMQWLQHITNSETVWSPYGNIQFGFRSRLPIIENKIFIYGEGGSVLLLPNSKISTEQSLFGGYGLFGFDFFANKSFSYFIEMGGMATGAKANKIQSNPIFSNGFTLSTGLRIYL